MGIDFYSTGLYMKGFFTVENLTDIIKSTDPLGEEVKNQRETIIQSSRNTCRTCI